MKERRIRRILVEKIDLDTCGVALILGVTRKDKIEVLRGEAKSSDLTDPNMVCIEVGGSGQTQLNNWDHHGEKELRSATFQAFALKVGQKPEEFARATYVSGETSESLLVDYIDLIDLEGPRALRDSDEVRFPTLSDVFSGMLLTTRDPVEQLHRGVEILRKVVNSYIDPYGHMRTEGREYRKWATYAEAKAENNRQVAGAVKKAQWGVTSSGLKLAWLETDFFGAPGALYGVGAQIVVAYSPHFGPARVPKFTVAGNGIRVNKVLPELNSREPGWGGPATGTILGSPREGSKLALKEVVKIVEKI